MAQTSILKTNDNTIVVGMTGRMDSVVVAYLLKKQGLNPLAVAVVNFEKISTKKKVDATSDQMLEIDLSLYGHCHISDLTAVKNICQQLNIPFYATSSKEEYREEVFGPLISSRLAGTKFSSCFFCHSLIIRTLIQKAKELGASKVATGHYARILSTHSGSHYVIGASNDSQHDQSYLLAGLSSSELSSLFLPLSEMRKSDTEKLGISIGVNLASSKEYKGDCLTEDPHFNDYIAYMTASSLRKTGSVMDFKNDIVLAEHKGLHNYFIGQTNLSGLEGGQVDKEATIVDINPSIGNIYLGDWKALHFKLFVVKNFVCDKYVDQSAPIEAFLKYHANDKSSACTIFMRSMNICVISLKEEQEGRAPAGKMAVFYNRAGNGGKIIGYGTVVGYPPFEGLDKLYESIEMADPGIKDWEEKAKEENKRLGF